MATEFKADPNYKKHYLFHRSLPPRLVGSKAENDYLVASKQWKVSYLHQAWPQLRYHKDFSLDVERAPDVQEFMNEQTGNVDERARQRAITARNKQRQRGIRTVKNEDDCKKLGKDWMTFAQLPAEVKRLKQEVIDNEADNALYGGMTEDFTEGEGEVLTVVGEKMRGGAIT